MHVSLHISNFDYPCSKEYLRLQSLDNACKNIILLHSVKQLHNWTIEQLNAWSQLACSFRNNLPSRTDSKPNCRKTRTHLSFFGMSDRLYRVKLKCIWMIEEISLVLATWYIAIRNQETSVYAHNIHSLSRRSPDSAIDCLVSHRLRMNCTMHVSLWISIFNCPCLSKHLRLQKLHVV